MEHDDGAAASIHNGCCRGEEQVMSSPNEMCHPFPRQWQPTMQSKLRDVYQISSEITPITLHRHTCMFDGTIGKARMCKLTGAELVSFNCT